MNIFNEKCRFTVGDIVYEKQATYGPRIQLGLQVMYVYQGSARILIDGRERFLAAGEMTLLLPDHVEWFEFSREEPTYHGWCTAHGFELTQSQISDFARFPEVLPLPAMIRQLTDRGKVFRLNSVPSAQNLYHQIGQMIFHEYFHAAGWPPEGGIPLPEPLRRVCEYIDEHFAEHLALPGIAAVAGITPAHLIRLFKTHLQTTPMSRIWNVRLRNGRRLLTETGLGIAEIAYRCGFQTPYHFSRRFKEYYGMSPRAYRKEKWNG